MELPVDEEYEEKVMGIPESFKVCSADFLSGKEYDETETSSHDPTSNARTGGKVYGNPS